MNGIPEDYVVNTCKRGQGEACCSFLIIHDGWQCAKTTAPQLLPMIEERRAAGTLKAKGDNCDGWVEPQA